MHGDYLLVCNDNVPYNIREHMSILHVTYVDIRAFSCYRKRMERTKQKVNKQKVKVVQVHTERRIPLFEKTCPICGTTFEGAKVARYCSQACSNKANYQNHLEARRQQRMARYYALKEGEQKRKEQT